MKVVLSLFMAVAPALFLVWYFYRQDKKKPEPMGLVLKVFLLGIVLTLPAIFLERLASSLEGPLAWSPVLVAGFHAFIVAAGCEELLKLFLVLRIPYRNSHFDEVMDGIVYAIVASLGFACMENILYVLSSGWEVAVLRAFTAIPLHAVSSGMMGYYIGRARFARDDRVERTFIMKGLLIAVLIHGTYDFLLFSTVFLPVFIGLGIFPLLIWAFIVLKKKIGTAVSEDVEAGRM
jgi:RsiW-degrading membrane proteinase PrsW (M82 family)